MKHRIRIALASLRFARTVDEGLRKVNDALREAASKATRLYAMRYRPELYPE